MPSCDEQDVIQCISRQDAGDGSRPRHDPHRPDAALPAGETTSHTKETTMLNRDIHRVANAYEDSVSISIHVYGGNIGKISRHVYDEQTGEQKTFISGYTNV